MAPRSPLLLLSLALALAGCNRDFRAAVSRAEAAAAAGDSHGAALAWREACRLDPDDAGVCARAAATARAFTDGAIAAAAPACAAGDPDRCGAAIRPAYDLSPEHPDVLRLLDETGRLHAERCPAATAGDPAAEVTRLACLEAWRGAVPTAGYAARLDAEARTLAGELARRATLAGTRERPAAVHALLATAACLDPAHRAAPAAADRAYGQRGVPLSLAVRARPGSVPVPPADRLCAEARASLPALVCADAADAIRLDLDVELSPPRYSMAETARAARRLVGIRQVPNPDRETAEERAREADERVRVAEREERRLADNCNRTGLSGPGVLHGKRDSDWTCRRADDARDERLRLESAADAAWSEARRIPPTVDDEVWAAVPYRERLHRWTAAFAARIIGPDGRSEEVTPPGAVLVHEELERPSIPDVGVEGDPFEDLPPGRFVDLAADALREAVAARAGAALRDRARAREAACDREGAAWSGPWLACRAEAAEWQGRPVAGELLRAPGSPAAIGCR